MKAYIHTKQLRTDGSYDSYLTREVEVKERLLWWQEKGLMYTATGYGSRIPTRYMVKDGNRWKRVYCRIFSNMGTLFIGKNCRAGDIVSIERS